MRAAHVGAFDVTDHRFADSDVIAQGRQAWDAVLGTVTLGKFFLDFGTIGMCEHALYEASVHVQECILYGRPVCAMSHIRALLVQAYGRLLAMKLYAYRALDYVHAASASERPCPGFRPLCLSRVGFECHGHTTGLHPVWRWAAWPTPLVHDPRTTHQGSRVESHGRTFAVEQITSCYHRWARSSRRA